MIQLTCVNHCFQPRILYRPIKAHFSTIWYPPSSILWARKSSCTPKTEELANEIQCQRLYYLPTWVTVILLTKACLFIWFFITLNVLIFYVHVMVYPPKKTQKCAKLIVWCMKCSHKVSNVSIGTKRLGATVLID